MAPNCATDRARLPTNRDRPGRADRSAELDETETIALLEFREPRFLQVRIVLRRQIINTYYRLALGKHCRGNMKSDKSGSAGSKRGTPTHHGL